MTDLERFFRRLVQALSADDPTRLRAPVPIQDIRGSLLPYRTNRRILGIDSSEDYELVLMRFCAGEGGFAHTSPDEARQRFERELSSPNTDLTVVQHFKDAAVSLSPDRVAWALATEAQAAPVATAPADVFEPVAEPAAKPAAPLTRCIGCDQALPAGQPVKFCPYCGKSQLPAHCSACNTELRPGWKFCPSCGQGA